MTIYDIDARIAEILSRTDPETGEIPEEAVAELETLAEDRDKKIENAACMVINLTAEAKAIREQEITLAQRRKSLENRAERIKGYVEYATGGEPFSSSRVQVKFTKSQAVEIYDEKAVFTFAPRSCLRCKYELDKAAIRAALKAGGEVPGAALVEHLNLQIK